MNSAGLQSKAIASRLKIKKRNVKPPVVGRFTQHQEPEETTAPKAPELQVITTEPNEVPVKNKTTTKKKAVSALTRYEARLTPSHEKTVVALHAKAKRETPKDNNGVNNSELLCGLIEFMEDINQDLSFRNIDFKRGQLRGPGARRIKSEIAKSIKEATLKNFIKSLKDPDSEVVSFLSELSSEEKDLIKEQILRNF